MLTNHKTTKHPTTTHNITPMPSQTTQQTTITSPIPLKPQTKTSLIHHPTLTTNIKENQIDITIPTIRTPKLNIKNITIIT